MVQLSNTAVDCLNCDLNKSQKNTGLPYSYSFKGTFCYMVKVTFLKDDIYWGHFICLFYICLHFFPLDVLSTEHWAKSIRKSGIESWIGLDFLCIFLWVTSLQCPYSKSWNLIHVLWWATRNLKREPVMVELERGKNAIILYPVYAIIQRTIQAYWLSKNLDLLCFWEPRVVLNYSWTTPITYALRFLYTPRDEAMARNTTNQMRPDAKQHTSPKWAVYQDAKPNTRKCLDFHLKWNRGPGRQIGR